MDAGAGGGWRLWDKLARGQAAEDEHPSTRSVLASSLREPHCGSGTFPRLEGHIVSTDLPGVRYC